MSTPPADALVFFGATGDLAYKKIFPSLQVMLKRGHLNMPIIGVAKSGWNLDQLKAGPSLYEYEPNTWGPSEVDSRVTPAGGWQNPTVTG